MTPMLILATERGVVTANRAGDTWRVVAQAIAEHSVTSLSMLGETILAGTRAGILRSTDGGQTWRQAGDGLTLSHLRWLASAGERFLAGTEPAGIFVSGDGGDSWRERPDVAALRDRYGWYLPYSPAAGCVRGFAALADRVYASAEVGGVLRSDDRGERWRLAAGSSGEPGFSTPAAAQVHPDVHSILVHPSSPDLVFAPTGGGFYCSADGGATWRRLYRCYCRAAWADPQDANHLILGPADGVSYNGRIEESHDGGKTWQWASGGLSVPWARHMVERFEQAGDELIAILSNGEVVASPLSSLSWRRILPEVARVAAACARVQ